VKKLTPRDDAHVEVIVSGGAKYTDQSKQRKINTEAA
jgi:hypothetical protein